MSIKSRLQRLEQSLPPADDGRFEEMRRILGLIHADPVATEAARALGTAEGIPGGFLEYREWVRAPGYQPYPQDVAAALESDDPRSALLALLEQRTGVRFSGGSS